MRQRIKITVPTDTIYERHLNEIARAQAERAQAVIHIRGCGKLHPQLHRLGGD